MDDVNEVSEEPQADHLEIPRSFSVQLFYMRLCKCRAMDISRSPYRKRLANPCVPTPHLPQNLA